MNLIQMQMNRKLISLIKTRNKINIKFFNTTNTITKKNYSLNLIMIKIIKRKSRCLIKRNTKANAIVIHSQH